MRSAPRAAVYAAFILTLATGGCSRPPAGNDAARPAQASENALSPRQTIERLITLRTAGKYQEMSRLVLASQRRAVADTLLAVDDFLVANRQLGEYLRDHVGLGLAESVDQSHLGASLDVFSRHVELLDEVVNGDSAAVSFTVDRRVPVRRARLQRIDGIWQYDSGTGFSESLPQAFTLMARGLRRMRDEIAAGAIPAADLKGDPERLAREVQLRLLDGVRLLAPPPANP